MDPQLDLRAIARRAAGRVLAQAGSGARSGPSGAPVAGVEVQVVERPGGPGKAPRARLDPPLVTVDCLRDVADGGEFALAPEALVTPLAEEEAQRRRVRLVRTVRRAGGGTRGVGAQLVVAVGSDHGGFALKGAVLDSLRELGHRATDLGPHDDAACDYPEYARRVAEAVAAGRADVGVCVDGAGIGSAMAAAKVPGVRPANCWNVASARNAREHNHANVLTLGAGHLDRLQAHEILTAFLTTAWGPGRHARRVGLIDDIERAYLRDHPSSGGPR